MNTFQGVYCHVLKVFPHPLRQNHGDSYVDGDSTSGDRHKSSGSTSHQTLPLLTSRLAPLSPKKPPLHTRHKNPQPLAAKTLRHTPLPCAPPKKEQPAVGFEPTTPRLQGGSSTVELHWQPPPTPPPTAPRPQSNPIPPKRQRSPCAPVTPAAPPQTTADPNSLYYLPLTL